MKALAVSELNAQIKSILEQTFMDILVCGEISSVKIHTSGHIYLTLKDEHSSIRCVMFKGNARSLKMTLEVGQNVEINGAISVYSPKGEYQILCKSIALAGIGELSRAFEALKTKLSAKGYFDSAHKKPLPRFPKRIALLTSATGAAKEDMLKVAQKRWENIHITLFNTIVQGVEAKDSIVRNIALADSFFGTKEGFDVLIIGRGGGSMEDMWAFNEECVAEAIFAARTPIVSAVGHEIDTFISDFVADIRAPTPSAAMEILLPDKNEYLRLLDEM
ncbi:exodeoxyribonuclease VII large subunit, partial [uncultured Helicobacter sp.]